MMEKNKYRKLRRNALSTIAGLTCAMLILAISFTLPPIFLNGLEKQISPMIDSAMQAVHSGDLDGAEEHAAAINALLERSEPTLKLFANHRDILEMMRAAQNLRALAQHGDAAAYIEDLCGIRIWLEFICDGSNISLGGLI